MKSSLSPFAPQNLVSRDGFGCPVPRQPAYLHSQAESGVYLRDSPRVPRRRPFIIGTLIQQYIYCMYIWPVAPVAQRYHVTSDTLG